MTHCYLRRWAPAVVGAFLPLLLQGQAPPTDDAATLRRIYDEALLRGQAYSELRVLTQTIGGRLAGSPQAAAAVEWAHQLLVRNGMDTVYLQPVRVPHWVRGSDEQGHLLGGATGPEVPLALTALGGSAGTPPEGIAAEVVVVQTLDELRQLGAAVKGKIVFFNRPMDQRFIRTGQAYGAAGDQRRAGPSLAASLGAVGALVRSLSTTTDEFPHTGGTRFEAGQAPIPCAAIATASADRLAAALGQEPSRRLYLKLSCQTLPDKLSYNVVGELRGTLAPDSIVLVGGHLDAWDNGEGAHDDGAGCVHAIEALRLFKTLGLRPRHTLRCVLFMNEENGLAGGLAYADSARTEPHLAALESDAGGFVPRGFGLDGSAAALAQLRSWAPLFEPYWVERFEAGGGGADIGPLRPRGIPLIGFIPDSQRYFDLHHTANDTFDKVNARELHLGCAAIASLLYLIDTHGLPSR
ncbi:MAG: M28 family peptidase [Bacteroidia bacterium]|nr:M28 family peptidase [Bacteroidia bacterium]